MEEIGKRLLQFALSKGLSRQDFALKLDISPAVLSHIASGRNRPSLDMILSFLRVFPQVNPDWLLFGTGPELRLGDKQNDKIENIKLILELKLLNEMNYNSLREKIEGLEKRLKSE